MYLYRVITNEQWHTTQQQKQVPRCKSDDREDCVHLTKYEDITIVAGKYFVPSECPVVLEINVSGLSDKIVWFAPTEEKPWQQPNAVIKCIDWNDITRYAHLKAQNGKEDEFMIGEFVNIQ